MSQGNLDNATNTRGTAERWRKAITIFLCCAVFAAYGLLADHAFFNTPLPSPWTSTSTVEQTKLDETTGEGTTASDTAAIWQQEIKSIENAIAALNVSPRNSRSTAEVDVLTHRFHHLESFVRDHRSSLPARFDPNSPLGRELILLRNETQQLRVTLDGAPSAFPPDSRKPAHYSTASEFETYVEQQEQAFQHRVESEAARLSAPLHEKLRSEIDRTRMETRDLEEQRALIEQKIDVELREQKEAASRFERHQALERDMSEVRRLLSPFISAGHTQPNRNAWDRIRTVEATPMSLGRLEKLGALKPTIEGLETLYIIGGMSGDYNDRPPGAFPPYAAHKLSKPHNLESVKRAQTLLRTHGIALTEENLLIP